MLGESQAVEIRFGVNETRSLGLVTLPDCILSHLLPEHVSVLTPGFQSCQSKGILKQLSTGFVLSFVTLFFSLRGSQLNLFLSIVDDVALRGC